MPLAPRGTYYPDVNESAMLSSTWWDANVSPIPDKIEEPSYLQAVFYNVQLDNYLYNAARQGFRSIENQFSNLDMTPLSIEDNTKFLEENPTFIGLGYAENIYSSQTVADRNDIISDIEYENKIRKELSKVGTVKGLLAAGASGFVDPASWLIPGGTIYRGMKLGHNISKSAVSAAAYTAGSVGVAEAGLHSLQQTRTFEESVANTLVSGLLGGTIGAGASALYHPMTVKSVKNLSAAKTQAALERDSAKIRINENGSLSVQPGEYSDPDLEVMQGGGAASVYDLEKIRNSPEYAERIKKSYSLYNMPEFIQKYIKASPTFRLLSSDFGWFRKFADDLFDNHFLLERNTQGQGSDKLELRMSLKMKDAIKAQSFLDKTYQEYASVSGGISKNLQADISASKKGLLNRVQFDEEVFKSMTRGDVSDISAVQKAASGLRPYFENIKNELIAYGFLPPGATVDTAISYMTRIYNIKKIQDNRYSIMSADVDVPFQTKIENYLMKVQDELLEMEGITGPLFAKKTELESQIKNNPGSKKELAKSLEEVEMEIAALPHTILDSEGNLRKYINKPYLEALNTAKSDFSYGKISAEELAEVEADYRSFVKEQANIIIDNVIQLGTEVLNNRYKPNFPTKGGGKPTMERVLGISDEEIFPFLQKDMNEVIRQYHRSTSFAIESTRYAQKLGIPDEESILSYFKKKAKTEYDRLSETHERPSDLRRQFDKGIQDMEDMLDAVQGFYGQPTTIGGKRVSRFLTGVKQWQVMRLLGMVISYVPVDLVFPVIRHGVSAWIRDGVMPILQHPEIAKMNRTALKDTGAAMETEVGRLYSSTMTGYDAIHDKNKFEVLADRLSRGFGNVTFANQLTDFSSGISGNIAQAQFARLILKAKEGKLTKKDTIFMSQMQMGPKDYDTLYEQFIKHGKSIDDTHYLMFEEWDADTPELLDLHARVRGALYSMIENTSARSRMVGDKPLVTRNWIGSALFLFQNFLFANLNKILLQGGIQRRDAAFLQGVMMMYTGGALAYGLRQLAYGREIKEEDILVEALSNSGLLAIILDPALRLDKFFAITGKSYSRQFNQGDFSLFLGPTVGALDDLTIVGDFIRAATHGEPLNERDLQKGLRAVTPYSNTLYFNTLVNTFSTPVAERLGLETIEDMEKKK